MKNKIYSVASVIGSLMVSGHIANAADLPARAPAAAPAPIFATASGYVEAGVGFGWASNKGSYWNAPNSSGTYSGRDRSWSIAGAGRANVWMAPNFSVQTDIWGGSESTKLRDTCGNNCTSIDTTAFNLGAHASYRDPNAYLVGAYGAIGSVNRGGYFGFGGSVRSGVVGLEGQGYFGNLTLYGQAGYASTIDAPSILSMDSWNARAVARYFVTPNTRLSGEVGYTQINLNNVVGYDVKAHQLHWSLGAEHKYASTPFAAFLKYDGADTRSSQSSPDYRQSAKSTSHAVQAGFRIYFNEGTLLANDRNGATLDIRNPISSFISGIGLNFGRSQI